LTKLEERRTVRRVPAKSEDPAIAEDAAIEPRTCGAVSDRLIQLYRETYGRGPTRGRVISVDHTLIAVMEDLLLPMEQELVKSGGKELVRAGRKHLRDERAERFQEEVERLTGRRVVGSEASFGFDPVHALEIYRFER
jgi:uncharacterized protein YbcI